MKLKKLYVLGASALICSALVGAVACGGGGGDDDGGDFDDGLNDIVDDLELDDDGNVVFDNVTLTLWTIVGSPDNVAQDKLLKEFNDEYLGQINIEYKHIGHFDYYGNLENTWANERDAMPDILFMHNEKTSEYAYKAKGYLYPLTDQLLTEAHNKIDFSNVYENIDRVTKMDGVRYAVPVDAHGFLSYFRQDIIKHNGLGFDDNTRFVPNSRAEYEELLNKLRDKADAGTLEVRNINKGENHAWTAVDKNAFFPSFTQSTDPDGLSALYANNGRLMDETQTNVTFQDNEGFKGYLTDQVTRWNEGLIGENGTNTSLFPTGNIVVFSEGPRWASQTYEPQYNNSELKKAENGISEEDAADPVINTPMLAAHADGWWTTDANKDTENGSKWYGNGHAMSISRTVKSLTKIAAALEFMNWYTQGKDATTEEYNLATWCSAGHMPAWKNVYESDEYEEELSKSITLKALGDPSDIIAMEPLNYETTAFNGLASACSSVINALKSSEGCTVEQAITMLNEVASSTQSSVDLLKSLE